jgi:ankyrin repeat protein/urea transporter
MNQPDTNILNDHKEISIWNSNYIKEFQKTDIIYTKQFYKYLNGTMPDIHIYFQDNPMMLLFISIFRSIGLFFGISNPILGFSVLIATLFDTKNNLLCIFALYGIIIATIICYLLKIDKELIYNGLYPSNGLLLSLFLCITRENDLGTTYLKLFIVLIPLIFLAIILFQSLCEICVKRLQISPLVLSPTIILCCWAGLTLYSSHFTTTTEPSLIKPQQREIIDISIKKFFLQIAKAVGGGCFSSNVYSAIPFTIGVFIASPILALTTWIGAFLAVLFQYLMGIQLLESDPLYFFIPLNGLITFQIIAGAFFILNRQSIIFGIGGVFLSNILTCTLSALLQPTGIPYVALPAQIIVMLFYLNLNTFHNLIKVELNNLTVPEDHLRRYNLSLMIMKRLHIVNTFFKNKSLSPQKLNQIEETLLPILLCSYTKFGFIDKIEELLDLGANSDIPDYDGRRPIHIASSEGNIEIVKLLTLKYHCNINVKDNYDNTPLSDALIYGHYEVAKFLYNHGGKIILCSEILASKLCYLVYYKKNEELKNWLDNGVSPNIFDYDNRTPLHIANNIENTQAIEILTNYQADVNMIDRWGRNTNNEYLHRSNANTELNIEILDEEKKSNIKSYIYIPFSLFKKYKKPIELISNELIESVIVELIKEGDNHMKKALLPSLICTIIYLNDTYLLQKIINLGIEINKGDYDNRTPLHIACASGNEDMVRILIWNGSNINIKDRFGFTPLYEAVQHNHKNIINILHEKSANLGLDEERSASILCWSAYNNDIQLIDRLYKSGINIESADYDDRKCIDIARDIENNNLVTYLENLVSS